MTLPPSPGSGKPWEQKPVNKAVQAGLFVLTIVLVSGALAAALVALMLATDLEKPNLGGAAIATVVAAVCGIGLFWSIPPLRRSVHSKPNYTAPPAIVRGQPFDVLYRNAELGLTLGGRGGLRFDEAGLMLQGTLQLHMALQLLLAAMLGGMLLFVLQVQGPMLLLAFVPMLVQVRLTRTIPYSQIRELEVKGLEVRFRCNGRPGQVAFQAAPVDGERLYRELLARFPGALGGWTI